MTSQPAGFSAAPASRRNDPLTSFLTPPDAQEAPELSFNAPTGTYLVINLDLDAPFPSFPFMAPINHWIQSGLVPQPASGDGAAPKLVAHDTPWIFDWAPPGPPPGSAPHRYLFLLYAQPEGFDVKEHAAADGKKVGMWGRPRYDLAAFEKKVGLGPVLAANYFNSN
jgi:phosphatidylethanolamine-binding protein (PEBP) family uncharacterized protein